MTKGWEAVEDLSWSISAHWPQRAGESQGWICLDSERWVQSNKTRGNNLLVTSVKGSKFRTSFTLKDQEIDKHRCDRSCRPSVQIERFWMYWWVGTWGRLAQGQWHRSRELIWVIYRLSQSWFWIQHFIGHVSGIEANHEAYQSRIPRFISGRWHQENMYPHPSSQTVLWGLASWVSRYWYWILLFTDVDSTFTKQLGKATSQQSAFVLFRT